MGFECTRLQLENSRLNSRVLTGLSQKSVESIFWNLSSDKLVGNLLLSILVSL